LPGVVSEGRQVINNVERVASLYLVKTTYSVILTLFFILIGSSYFFFPIHQTLLGMVGIGIPSFFLALETNSHRVLPGFLGKILRTAVPGGVTIALNLITLKLLQPVFGLDIDQARLIAVIITGIASLMILLRISWPLNALRSILLAAMTVLFFLALLILRPFLYLPALQQGSLLIILGFAVISYPLLYILSCLSVWRKSR
jgi:cation-transporting P-type ATPase E